jgi:hypothetical protein
MQALLIFLPFFLVGLFYICTCLLLLFFLSKVLQNQNTIQPNQQISYQLDIDSLLNIVHHQGLCEIVIKLV